MSKIAQSPSVAFSGLDALLAVAAERSFRRAALELGVSASALSHSVRSLEERLGVKLFHRTTRSVSLSDAGARLLERVQPALRELRDALDTANDFRATPRGTLRLNTSLPAALHLFESLLLPFMRRYPEVELEIVTEGRLVDIVAGGFDAGIRPRDAVPQDMVSVPCSPPLRFRVVASPAYLKQHGKPRTPADLMHHACIKRRLPSGAPLPWELAKNAESLVLDVPGTLTLDSSELSIAAALQGVGLAWSNAWAVDQLIAERRLVAVLDDWCQSFPGVCLFYPPHRHVSAALRALVALIREFGLGRVGRGKG